MGVCLWNLELYIIWGYAYGRFWLLYKNNAQKCTEKWAYLKNGLSYSLVAWRGCYYQQSPPIATFTYAKGWKEKFKHVNIFKSTVLLTYYYFRYLISNTSTLLLALFLHAWPYFEAAFYYYY